MKTRQYVHKPAQDMSRVSAKKFLQTRPFQVENHQGQRISQGQQVSESVTRGFDLTSTQSFSAVEGSIAALGQPLQTKLTIGAPNDKYEQEADRVAHDVVRRMNAPQFNATPNALNPLDSHLRQRHKLEAQAIKVKDCANAAEAIQFAGEDRRKLVKLAKMSGESDL
ncbi:MAG: hypothetical protein AAF215_06075 [Cyanobacteria bacterium P01_A01_bin.123]